MMKAWLLDEMFRFHRAAVRVRESCQPALGRNAGNLVLGPAR